MEFFESLRNSLGAIIGERVELGNNSVTTLNIIVWSLFIGFIIAVGVSVCNRLLLGTLIARLKDKEAFSEDSALTAKELGCANPLIRLALCKNSTFRRIVRMKGDTETVLCADRFTEARFYLPEENIRRAETVYGKTELTAGNVLLSVAAFFALAIVAFIVIPELIQMLSNFISTIAPRSNII